MPERVRFCYNPVSAQNTSYDPATGVWTPTGSMVNARREQTATLLPNGQVLVVSGRFTRTAGLYDPVSGNWTTTTCSAAHGHTATSLRNGKVLVAGGESMFGVLAGADLYKAES